MILQLESLHDYTTGWSTALRDLDLRGCINLSEDSLVDAVRRFPGLTRLNLQENYMAVKDGCAAATLLYVLHEFACVATGGSAPVCAVAQAFRCCERLDAHQHTPVPLMDQPAILSLVSSSGRS